MVQDSNRIHILSSKKNENLLHVLYDKTAKAEHNKQIELNASRKYRIYRYEMTLNEKKIKSEFQTTDLDKLHNDQLYSFVYSVIEKGLSNFKILVQTSVRDTQNKLKELYEEKGKDGYIKTFFETQLNHAMDYLYPLTLDESIFLFIDVQCIFLCLPVICIHSLMKCLFKFHPCFFMFF